MDKRILSLTLLHMVPNGFIDTLNAHKGHTMSIVDSPVWGVWGAVLHCYDCAHDVVCFDTIPDDEEGGDDIDC